VDAPRGPTASTVVCHRRELTFAWWMDQGNHLYDIWQHELKPDHFNDELAISQSLLYLIRLNSPTLSLLKRRLNQPATDKLRQRLWSESGRVLSLPIRGSDKCGEEMFDSGGGKHRRSMYESSCLPWSGYVEAIDSVRRYDLNVTTILVTSEDVRYIQLAKAHASALWRNGSRSVRFVFNDADVSPGSGQLSKHMRGDPRYLKHIERRMGHSSLNIDQSLSSFMNPFVPEIRDVTSERPRITTQETRVLALVA
jgi:hypothetical protein